MLTKPAIADHAILHCLNNEFGIPAARLHFLALGADIHTAVYAAETADAVKYFIKLRSGNFEPTSVTLPHYLSEQGIAEIIAPLATQTDTLWADLENFKVIVYPFVNGVAGYAVKLSARQWATFGAALAKIHASVSASDWPDIPRETFSPDARERVKAYVRRADGENIDEPIARALVEFIKKKRAEILALVARTEQLAAQLESQPREFVLNHSDIHAGNLLVAENGALYLVDWDNPLFAPRERDLMFIGGAQGFRGDTPEQECELFFRGYGEISIHRTALAYYRFERIVQDLAVECQQIFALYGNDADRAQELVYFQANFLPGGTLELAYQTDRRGNL